MGHEERGDHPQPPHLRQLVPAQQLGVDHHRPAQPPPRLSLQPLHNRQVLLRRLVAVAVGQNLHVPLQGAFQPPIHLLVGEDRIAPVVLLPLIGWHIQAVRP